ncbi:MAG: DUF4388 domain-containing protein [Blastocatellia bacterium]|nr:DUF4388 domain-containing protein [Blastocatellia bacterium]MBL8194925.1 DUF4388 domain-containing protein [Blastocatellia bacterium]MBN8723507.1 DUF4388 domain-containing protein [Acidobacteriota bacterium]
MALKGRIPELSVTDLIMIHCFGRTRACVKLTSDKTKAEIYFDNGNIIDARCDASTGMEALYRAFSVTEGKYQVELNVTSQQQTIQTPWKDILKSLGIC